MRSPPAKFTAFLDFLQGEVTSGRVVVQTTAQVIGGPVQPPVPALTGRGAERPARKYQRAG